MLLLTGGLGIGGSGSTPVLTPSTGITESTPAFLLGSGGDLGTDISTFPDLDTTFSLIGKRRALAEAIARRYLTPRGALWKHPSYGCDIRRHLNAVMTSQRLQVIKQETEAQAEEEERVLACENRVVFDDASRTIHLLVSLTDADGPFAFTAAISQLGLAQLTFQE